MNEMQKCPCCGQSLDYERCQAKDCDFPAEYEGWHRVRDFSGNPTGLIRLLHVCDDHTSLLIAKEKPEA